MKVKDLIKELQKADPEYNVDVTVPCFAEGDFTFCEIEGISEVCDLRREVTLKGV